MKAGKKKAIGRTVAVIGGRRVGKALMGEAREAGRLLALAGATVMTGGLGGVMEAASRGAKEAGGLTVGILPYDDKGRANPHVDVAVATGMGLGRNVIIARSADGLIAVGGQYGTLSEIAFALQLEKPVVGISSWPIRGIVEADGAADAVEKLLALID